MELYIIINCIRIEYNQNGTKTILNADLFWIIILYKSLTGFSLLNMPSEITTNKKLWKHHKNRSRD